MPHHRIDDVLADLLEGFRLVVVGIAVDDEEVVVATLLRLLGCVLQEGAGVELGERKIAEALHGLVVHD